MIPCFGCERAREMLEGYVDGELTLSDQVAVETHLRSCDTCTARVEDLQIIAGSLRFGLSALHTPDDERALAEIQASTLVRLRAERDQEVGVRLREAFVDLRLLWPALGAVTAVAIGVAIALGMLRLAGTERPESLAAMIQAIAQRGVVHAADNHGNDPGSEGNPLRLDAAMFGPQVIDDGAIPFDGLTDDEAVFTLTAVLGPGGRIANYELLGELGHPTTAGYEAGVEAVHDAVSRMRFAPALAADGSGIAVEMVIMMAKTTAIIAPPPPVRTAPAPPAMVMPSVDLDEAPDGDDLPAALNQRSGLLVRAAVV